jgi:uncharacterized integral membrane protein
MALWSAFAMSTPEKPPKQRDLASKTVAALAVAALLLAFGLSNRKQVPVDWLVGTTHTSLIIVILVSAGLGAILGAAAVRSRGRRASRKDQPPPTV